MRRRRFLRAGGTTIGLAAAGLLTDNSHGVGRTLAKRQQDSYEPIASIDVPGATEAVTHHDGEIAYLATGDGFAVVDVSEPATPELLAERRDIWTAGEDPLTGIQDLWPAGDRLVVVGPTHHADDQPTGFAMFDVSEPANPQQRFFYPTEFHIHNSHISDDVVYLTGSGLDYTPLVMIDVSTDEPAEVGRWSLVDHDSNWLRVPSPYRTLHDVYVQDDIAYLPYWDAGTWLVDVSDPADPIYLSHVGDFTQGELEGLDSANVQRAFLQSRIPPGNDHVAQVGDAGEVLAVGKEAWGRRDQQGVLGEQDALVGDAGGIALYDVSDPTAPEALATIEPPRSISQVWDGWHTTAHNFDLAGDRLYSSWYFGGVKVHDISEPTAPEEVAWWREPAEATFWTAQAAEPGETFVASSTNFASERSRVNDTREALYVFPDRAGTQSDPVDLTTWPTEALGPKPEDWDPPASWTGEPEQEVRTDESDGAVGVGFGIPTAIGAAGWLGYRFARRAAGKGRQRDESGS